MNIKLPGDETWSKVTIDTAKADMDRSAKDESTTLLKRLQSKAMSGPREACSHGTLQPSGQQCCGEDGDNQAEDWDNSGCPGRHIERTKTTIGLGPKGEAPRIGPARGREVDFAV